MRVLCTARHCAGIGPGGDQIKAILYSTHCPCCKTLEERLRRAEIEYAVVSDTEQILALGITHVPILEIDGQQMNYPAAIRWLNERKASHEN